MKFQKWTYFLDFFPSLLIWNKTVRYSIHFWCRLCHFWAEKCQLLSVFVIRNMKIWWFWRSGRPSKAAEYWTVLIQTKEAYRNCCFLLVTINLKRNKQLNNYQSNPNFLTFGFAPHHLSQSYSVWCVKWNKG